MAESRIARAWERLRNFVAPTPVPGEIAIGDTRRWPSLASAMIGDWVPYNPDDLAITKGGLRIYDKMREDDQVKACLWITKAAIIGPGWILEPGDKTGAAQDLAETITDTLEHLEGPRTFDDSIAEVLTAADYGFSICEKVYAVDDTGLHLSALKGRAPHQIDFKQDAFDNIEAILQQQGGTRLQMDPSRFVHFMNQPEFGNPYGRSMLREAYTSWWYKRNIQQWWAQFMEKLAIPPVYGKYGATEKPNAPHVLEVLKRLQAGTALTVAEPWELGLLETTRDPRATFEAAVDHFNLGIARACLLFDKSGLAGRNVQQGSHALAQTQFDVWVLVVGSMQRRLCKCLQEQLIDELAEFEAPGVAPPALRFLPLTDRNKEAIANLWIQAVMNGAALTTIEDENHLRDMLEFPERQADARDAAKMQAAIAMPTPAPKSGGGGSSNTGGDGVPNAPQSTTPIPKPPTANMAQHVCECPPIPMAFAAGNIEGLAAHLANKYGTDHPFSDCMDADELGGYDVEARRAICGRVKALALEAKGGEPVKHAEWDESKHPRVESGSPEGGQFTSGGGGEPGGQTDKKQQGLVERHFSDANASFAALTPQQKAAYRGTAQAIFGNMMPGSLDKFGENVSAVKFYADKRALAAALGDVPQGLAGRVEGAWVGDSGGTTGSQRDTGVLHLWGPYALPSSGEKRAQNWAHEFGHAIDGGRSTYSSTPEWHDIWRREIASTSLLSEYAKTNASEGFAEFMRGVNRSPVQMRHGFPSAFAYLRRLGLA